MKVSIVMLAYNHERFIDKAIECVLMQETDFSYELIIGEDCSPDNTREIIEKYEKENPDIVKPIYRTKNVGMVRNLLDCLKQCKGEYIALLEGDDVWISPHKLQYQVAYMDEHSECVWTAHNYWITNVNGEIQNRALDIQENWKYDESDLANFTPLAQTSTWVVRNVVDEVFKKQLIKVVPFFWMPADRLAPLMLLRYGTAIVFPQCMSKYRFYIEENGTNWTSKYGKERRDKFLDIYLMHIVTEFFMRKSQVVKEGLLQERLKTFRRVRARGNNYGGVKKIKLKIQSLIMLVVEPHKIKMAKMIISTHKYVKKGKLV